MNCTRFAAAGIAAMALGVALPSVASAEDYCVAPNYDCGANNVEKLQDALNLAASTVEPDRVLLGEGTYVAPPVQTAFSYNAFNSPVEIAGAGRGRTILTAQPFAIDRVLYLGGEGSSVHDLTIQLPPKASQGFRGLLLSERSTARQVEVTDDAGPGGERYGAQVSEGAVLEDSTITLNREQNTTAVLLGETIPGGPQTAMRGTVATAQKGIEIYGGATVERSRVFARDRALTATGGHSGISDSVFAMNGSAGTVIRAETKAGSDTNVSADGLTVFGPSTADVGGVQVTTSAAPTQSVSLRLTNSIVRAGLVSLAAVAGGSGKGTIVADYSDYNPSENVALGAGAGITESHVSNVGALSFDETPGREYALLPGSPLIDRGDPDVPQGLDVNGEPRVADGNGDGIARRDLGAFELQPPAPQPQPQADTQPPVVTGFRARRLGVSYRLSERARVTVRVQRRLPGRRARYRTLGKVAKSAVQGANRLKLTGRIRAKAVRPGRYRAVIVAIDAAGNRSAPKAASFRVTR